MTGPWARPEGAIASPDKRGVANLDARRCQPSSASGGDVSGTASKAYTAFRSRCLP